MTRRMKDSGVEWIGEIPEDWGIQNLKSILDNRNELNNPIKTELILSLTNDRGVIPYSEKGDIGNKAKEDLTKYKLAYPGDIIVNSMNVIIGSVGLSKYFGAASPVYYMLYVRDREDSIRYYNYLFQTKELQSRLKGYGNGIMEHRLRIPMINLNKLHLPYPPKPQQKSIADFLDRKVSQIDNIISKTKESIDQYKKYKESLITETVTKGLDENADMKDSGIEWIGDIPEHWDVIRLKDLGRVFRGTADKNIKEDEIPVKLVQYTDIYYNRRITRSYDKFLDITVTRNELENARVSKGDILLTTSSEVIDDIGRSSVIMDGLDNHVIGSDTLKITIPEDVMNIDYREYLIENHNYLSKFASISRGITRYRFNMSDFKCIKYPIPPLEEQKSIASYLDKKCNEIDKIISSKEKLISEMEDYKKSLIYEAVTGKREVI